ncbi:MAG: DEAD/DEAH box helicase, partial [Candidatus Methanomethylophilus sp.]|nr:DEAD/DEAH box helicase [Methanomethylophilus sp.]
LNEVVKQGVQTKVLMLSATPVNNRFYDLRNQLEIAYEGNPKLIQSNLKISRPLDEVFRNAQKAFNKWSKLPMKQRTTDSLLKMLDFDFFEVLDSVTIARSRRHIEKNYNMDNIGRFPTRLAPISKRPKITDLEGVVSYKDINNMLSQLNLAVYVPTEFLLPSKASKYIDPETINRRGREQGIRRLMSMSLLKRLESSVHSFCITVNKVLGKIKRTVDVIDNHNGGMVALEGVTISDDDLDDEYSPDETFALGKNFKIDLNDMDYTLWRSYLVRDIEILNDMYREVSKITPEHDNKLKELRDLIVDKVQHPINGGNRKVLIFSAFTDTANYLYDNLKKSLWTQHGLNLGLVTGQNVKSTVDKLTCDFNDVLTCFSPISKRADLLIPNIDERIDILIGTDCISEGQNLQDCDYCVSYDIHWNPVRIIQRFGRIDRIGSTNNVIQLVNFWPDVNLDEYIRLKDRVETRMKISVLTSTGDDDPINLDEHGDLEYRAEQLKRLQEEVVDIEEMQSGVSILDLGLNEFRLDLVDFVKTHGNLDRSPLGLHAVVPSSAEMPPGCIFVLKNINNNVNIDNQNRLHPFYMVYVNIDEGIVCDHLSPRKLLDIMRFSCRGHMEPNKELCDVFNIETKDGKDMAATSKLLETAIKSIIEVKEQSDLDSFMSGSDVSFRDSVKINGLDDFELICFLVVR